MTQYTNGPNGRLNAARNSYTGTDYSEMLYLEKCTCIVETVPAQKAVSIVTPLNGALETEKEVAKKGYVIYACVALREDE